MKKILFFLTIAQLVNYGFAQSEALPLKSSEKSIGASLKTEGIRWVKGLSWTEVKERAARENKYIFLDCYTSWCTPCKMMDEYVYGNDSVGNYFNKYFINVKVQMDKTRKDNSFVKSWYNDADSISKKFRIEAFPCFIFLAPDGRVVHQAVGYIGVSHFISMAQKAMQPGKKYDDLYNEYDRLLSDYRKGIVNYDRMVYMIKSARRLDPVLARQLTEDFEKYISTLDNRQRFRKDIISFMSMNDISTKSNAFLLFFKHGKRIDKIMEQKGYAMAIIDKVIYSEIVVPFFNEQNKNLNLPMTGMYLNGIDTDYSEADWGKLRILIKHKFNKVIANRNVLSARIEWYLRHWNIEASCRYKLVEFKKYPPVLERHAVSINSHAWNAFVYVADKEILNGYISWMEKVVKIKNYPNFLDTYANLLYKVGRKGEAIQWEEKAVIEGKESGKKYKVILEKMKRGEPTY